MYRMVLNESDADDLTQDVFIRIYHNLPKFRGQARFSTWLYRIAANTAKSFLRQKARTPVQDIDILSEPAGPVRDRPDVLISELETDKAITSALGSLPTKLRAAIVLVALEGLSYDEAAKVEGCLKAALYWRVHKARQLLKEKLTDYL